MKLEIKGLTKTFGSFTANDRIDLTIEPGRDPLPPGGERRGQVHADEHALRAARPDVGRDPRRRRAACTFVSPGDAIAAGIGMVHQHFMLVPVFTVAENVMLGRERTRGLGVLNRKAAADLVRELSERYSLAVDPDALVEDLPVGVQQRVEILKALSNDAKVLILDEPTAVLTPQEIDELMDIMRALKEQGTSIIFITHKLREVKAVGDKITRDPSRQGRRHGAAQHHRGRTGGDDGRPRSQTEGGQGPAEVGATVLDVRGVTVVDPRGHQVVKDVSFEARAGEVLGIAGVQGNGQTELIKSLLGLIKPDAGEITSTAKTSASTAPAEPRGRHRLHPRGPLPRRVRRRRSASRENLVLDLYRNDEFSRASRSSSMPSQTTRATGSRSSTSAPRAPETPVASLSGGNQQKVVVAREFSRPLKVLIASQPTRGVDVGSIEFIHKRIIGERDRGTAVVIVSTELDEIFALSDRIAVMYDGRIVATVSPDIAREDIGLLMAGAVDQVEVAHEHHRDEAADTGTGVRREPVTPDGVAAHRQGDRGSVFIALVIGAVLIAFSDEDVIESVGYFFSYPRDFFVAAWDAIWSSYGALVTGSVGSWNAIGTTLERAAPLICAGLGVTLAFRAGLFNIGAQGQLIIGAICAGYVGFTLGPAARAAPAPATGGRAARRGALGRDRRLPQGEDRRARGDHHDHAQLPRGLRPALRPQQGSLPAPRQRQQPLAARSTTRRSSRACSALTRRAPRIRGRRTVWWMLERSTLGFELRAVGANAAASRTAGMSVPKVYTLAMLIAGALAGLAAVMQVLGHHDSLSPNVAGAIGFDAITVALLGRATPLGTVLAGLLFGALSVGGVAMQAAAGTPKELTQVLQALIVLFVAAPALVKGIMRIKDTGGESTVMAKGWGS